MANFRFTRKRSLRAFIKKCKRQKNPKITRMKIICIGRNYADHAKEMSSPLPDKPVFFMKPDTALLGKGQDFYFPDFTKDLHHEIELVVKIIKNGKNIEPKFAPNYYSEIGLGIDFTARDL